MSRGRAANHLYVAVPGAGEEHALLRRATLRPPTSRDVLRGVLEHEEAARSATTVMREQADPVPQLRHALERYRDGVRCAPAAAGDQVAPAPLPWLPPVPRCEDPAWQRYLQARAGQVAYLAA